MERAVPFGEPPDHQPYKGMLIDCGTDSEIDALVEELYSRFSISNNQLNVLIIRKSYDTSLSDNPDFTDLALRFLSRFSHCELRVLYSTQYAHRLSDNLNPGCSFLNFQPPGAFLTHLRETELRWMAEKSGACYKRHSGVLYRTPSGILSRCYFRAGCVQTSAAAIGALTYWLLPYAQGCTTILTETWSISSTGINTARVLAHYLGTETSIKVNYETLSNYLDDAQYTDDGLRNALVRIALRSSGRILFLVSANMTGGLISRFRRLMTELNIDNDRISIIALYKLGRGIHGEHLCDLSEAENVDFSPISEDEVSGSRTIVVDERSYYPSPVQEKVLRIRVAEANVHRDFFNAYAGKQAFSVHYERRIYGVPHHDGIHVDVAKLMEAPRFLDRLRLILPQLGSHPNRIITRDTDGARAFARLVASQYQDTVPIVVHAGGTDAVASPAGQGLADLTAQDHVLVVDDATATGSQLRQYQLMMRDVRFPGRIHYLVGVGRPASDAEWNALERQLAYRNGSNEKHTLHAVERILLPRWTRITCPWCREMRYITQEISRLGVSALSTRLAARRAELASSHEGLLDHVFWKSDDAPPMRITPNSIFTERTNGSEADVIAMIASTLQTLRQLPPNERLEYAAPYCGVLDPRVYLGAEFNDAALLCGLWRCATANDVSLLNGDLIQAKGEAAETLMRNQARHREVGIEYHLGIAEGKLPPAGPFNSDIQCIYSWVSTGTTLTSSPVGPQHRATSEQEMSTELSATARRRLEMLMQRDLELDIDS
jgi:hypothetical protein